MTLRKVISAVILMTMFIGLFGYDFEFADGVKATCDIVGKEGNIVYIANDNLIYKVQKNDITSITMNGQDFKAVVYGRADWMNQSIDVNNAVTYEVQKKIAVDTGKEKLINYKDMDEREFQMYLAQQNAVAMNNHADKITKTMWTIWGVNIALCVIGTAVVIASN